MKHTPGPWRLDEGQSSRVYLIDGKDGAVGELVFAETRNPADARLIAAAPELLEALQELMDDDAPWDGMRWADACDKARAAIAKARGES